MQQLLGVLLGRPGLPGFGWGAGLVVGHDHGITTSRAVTFNEVDDPKERNACNLGTHTHLLLHRINLCRCELGEVGTYGRPRLVLEPACRHLIKPERLEISSFSERQEVLGGDLASCLGSSPLRRQPEESFKHLVHKRAHHRRFPGGWLGETLDVAVPPTAGALLPQGCTGRAEVRAHRLIVAAMCDTCAPRPRLDSSSSSGNQQDGV